MTLGDGENPLILAAVYNEEASLYAVQQIMGEMLPEVTLEAQYEKRFDLGSTIDSQEQTRVLGRLNVPFYQGGGVSARVRQAKETNNQLKKEVEDARLRVHADVIANWGILQSSGPAISSAEAAVAANKIALTGVREEEKVGQRTTLDVLDAQRELLNRRSAWSSRSGIASSPNMPSMRRSAGWTHKRSVCQCLITIRSSTMTS